MRKGLTHGAIEPPGATGAHTILIDRLLSCRLGEGGRGGGGEGGGDALAVAMPAQCLRVIPGPLPCQAGCGS